MQRKKLQPPSQVLKTTLYTALGSSLQLSITTKSVLPRLPSAFLMTSSGSFSSTLTTASCPLVLSPPAFLPPPLINRAPSLSIIGDASSLYSIIAHKKKKPPHATSVAVMERFRLWKWRLINQKANLKSMSCSHQWGNLLFGHTRVGKGIQFAMLNPRVQVLVIWIQVSTILLELAQELDWRALIFCKIQNWNWNREKPFLNLALGSF